MRRVATRASYLLLGLAVVCGSAAWSSQKKPSEKLCAAFQKATSVALTGQCTPELLPDVLAILKHVESATGVRIALTDKKPQKSEPVITLKAELGFDVMQTATATGAGGWANTGLCTGVWMKGEILAESGNSDAYKAKFKGKDSWGWDAKVPMANVKWDKAFWAEGSFPMTFVRSIGELLGATRIAPLLAQDDNNLRRVTALVLAEMGDTQVVRSLKDAEEKEQDAETKVAIEAAIRRLTGKA